ncbi:IQ domain-containing protein E [Octopus bimaculoides]|uniref:IQ domain-containing protein E n=1 Tax=Octopus bimaculoides TaxID=37653 RepID=A0A0L8I1H3_OCTBM|nr:IQ domain-containing protein E [Octopus bimaculoides]|eukprot:XP_014767642.1 PREDICTED: IQ domain-containing protein E-like [Octopus bimaculoides]
MSSRPISRKKTKIKSFSRSDSAPTDKTAPDVWLTSLKNTNENTGTNTVLLKKVDQNVAYNSTSAYLRQVMCFGKTRKMPEINSPRLAAGTPLYKSKEEYYDEELRLRKEIGSLKHENSTMKTKLRRLEEDNLKKEKEIAALLDTGKNEEFRRTLTDRRSDSFMVISNLKHKIMKLEAQLKAKETVYLKLKSNLKTTKVEELQVQVETLYQEIVRLQNCNSEQKFIKESGNNTKMKALSDTVLCLNQTLEQLRNENQSLKEDLVEALENPNQNKVLQSLNHSKTAESVNQNKINSETVKDMKQHELLTIIAEQKKIIKDFEREKAVLDDYLENKPWSKVPGKIQVQSTIIEQLEQLDKQETHLLEELKNVKQLKKQMKSERNHYKKKSEEFELECQKLQLTIKELELKLKLDNNKATYSSVRHRSRTSPTSENHNSRRNSKTRHKSVENIKNLNEKEEIVTQVPQVTRNEEVLKLRKNHAAKRIQKAWHLHDANKQALVIIQGTLLAHAARKKFLKQSKKELKFTHLCEEESSLERSVKLIQSVVRAHYSRIKQQQNFRENFKMEQIVQR